MGDESAAVRASAVLDRSIVVVGMMGAGKTTLGRALAAHFDVACLDSDDTVMAEFGASGRELVVTHGIEWLHAVEARTLQRHLDAESPVVITAAASTIESAACRALLRERATVCWVDVPVDELVGRLGRPDHRRTMDRSELERRDSVRHPLFAAAADIRLDGLRPAPETLAAVLAHLHDTG
ncbi:MAG: shikimate kinase [Ilumatobacteraceae bacterium]